MKNELRKKWLWWAVLFIVGGLLFFNSTSVYFLFPLLWAIYYSSYWSPEGSAVQAIGLFGVAFGLVHIFSLIHITIYEHFYGVNDGIGMAWATILVPAIIGLAVGFILVKVDPKK